MNAVTSRCAPSADQASAHGSAGTVACATTFAVAASIFTTVASCEQAAKIAARSGETTRPTGSLPTGMGTPAVPVATSTAYTAPERSPVT